MSSQILVPRMNIANQYLLYHSQISSVCLLEFELSQLGRTVFDVAGGGDCFFKAVSHQLYGNPKSHFYVHNVGF